jgi:hypothetical protein
LQNPPHAVPWFVHVPWLGSGVLGLSSDPSGVHVPMLPTILHAWQAASHFELQQTLSTQLLL